jgi:hypothetical protein
VVSPAISCSANCFTFINHLIIFLILTVSLSNRQQTQAILYKYYVFGHYPSTCVCLKTALFIFQNNVSETGFCLRLQVKPTQLGPIDRASPYLRTESSLRNVVFWKINRTIFR